MPNKPNISFVFLAALLFASCSSTSELPQKALFPFEFENESYQIVSINAPSGEGMNYLVKINNDSTLFRTLDQDQDGIIDLIQYGAITLKEANLIYAHGIRKAQDDGKLKERNKERIFKHSEEGLNFIVQTFGIYYDLLYNRFVILDAEENTEESFLDFDADGILDEPEFSNRSVEEVQPYYKKTLQLGINQKRIQLQNEKYVVKIITKQNPS